MGADMIMGACSAPINVGIKTSEKALAALTTWAAGASRLKIEDYFDQFMPGGCQTMQEAYEERGEEEPLEGLAEAHSEDPELAWGRRCVTDHLVSALDYLNNSRSVAEFRLGGQLFWLSGGLSWGDEPDGYAEVSQLDWAGVFDNEQVTGTLDLSTAHIPSPLLESLTHQKRLRLMKQAFTCRIVGHEYGWILFLGAQEGEGQTADWAKPILEMARATNCRFINFDEDAEVSPWLPNYHNGTPLEQLASAAVETHNE